MSFLNKYESIGKKMDDLLQTNGENYVKDLIMDLRQLLKGCGYNV